jgi:hypothetical protein
MAEGAECAGKNSPNAFAGAAGFVAGRAFI